MVEYYAAQIREKMIKKSRLLNIPYRQIESMGPKINWKTENILRHCRNLESGKY